MDGQVNGDAGKKKTHENHGTTQRQKQKRLHGGRRRRTEHASYPLKAGAEPFGVEEAGAASSQNASQM